MAFTGNNWQGISHTCDEIVQVESFNEHPDEHGSASVLENDVEGFA